MTTAKRGRPSKVNREDEAVYGLCEVNREDVKKSITVRIDDGERDKLDAYCRAKNITRSEAIRAWINAIC